jgi:hypothetical protein
MIRAIYLLAALALSACGAQVPYQQYTAAEIAALEEANAEIVDTAAVGCDLAEDVRPVGAHGFEPADHYAEDESEITLILSDLCMIENVVVVNAAAEVGLSDAIVLSAFGYYTYRPEFLAGKSSAEMTIIDRGLLEAIDRLQSQND